MNESTDPGKRAQRASAVAARSAVGAAAALPLSLAELALDAVTDAILLEDSAGRLIFANDAARALCDFAPTAEHPEELAALIARTGLCDERRRSVEAVDGPRWPGHLAVARRRPVSCILLMGGATSSGSRIIRFESTPTFDARGELQLITHVLRPLTSVADQVRRAQLHERAAELLPGGLDVAETFQRAARLAVPGLADACVLELGSPEAGLHGASALAHGRGDVTAIGRALAQFRAAQRPGCPAAAVLASGQPQLFQLTGSEPEPLRAFIEACEASRYALAPLWVDQQLAGVVWLGFEPARPLLRDGCELELAGLVANHVGRAVDSAQLYESALEAGERARNAADWSARLQRLASALTQAASLEQVSELVVREAMTALGATAGALFRLDEDTQSTNLVTSLGYPPEAVKQFGSMPLAVASPVTEAVTTGAIYTSSSHADRVARFPHLQSLHEQLPWPAAVVAPLISEGRVRGAVGFHFAQERQLDDEQRVFLETVASHCAQSLERARLYDDERRARAAAETEQMRSAFLAEASALLASSLDYETTLERVAQMAVPTMADWCTVDILEAGEIRPRVVAVHHTDASKLELAVEMRQRFPAPPDASAGVPAVIRTGRSELYEDVPDELLRESAQGEEHYRLIRRLGLRSAIIVPVRSLRGVLGAITFVMSESERHYEPQDLRMAEQVGLRAGMAIENSLLYDNQRRARDEAESAVKRTALLQALAASLSAALAPEDVARAAIQQAVAAFPGCTGAALILSDPDGLRIVAAEGSGERMLEGAASLASDEGPLRRAMRELELVTVSDTSDDAEVELDTQAAVAEWTILPLAIERGAMGVIALGFDGPVHPSAQDCDLMLAIGRQAAQALARAQHVEALDEAQARSADTNRTLEAIISASPAAIVVLDESGGVRRWNAAAEEIFGWSEAEAVGQFFPPGNDLRRDDVLANMHRVTAGEQLVGIEARRRTRDGREVDIAVWAAPVRQADGSLHYLAVMADITARKRDEEELRKSEERIRRAYLAAKEAERRKDEFLAMLGHELRNPLAPIVTALQVLRMRPESSAARELTVIDRQVRHLLRLVDDLLDVSRITRGKLEIRPEPVEIAEAITKAVELASPLLEQHRHTLSVEVPRRGLVVEGDSVRLAQIVSNLLTNAAKYTEPGGHVRIRAARENESVVIRVADDGIGIPTELLPHVFELFVQAPQSIDRGIGGLGLGLTIVKRLTELHRGSVEVHSEGRGKGSEFTVKLPVAAAEVDTGPMPQLEAPGEAGASQRIMVVDDNVDAAEMMAMALTHNGYDTAVAHDGPSALALAAEFHPDVALLDIGLPVMDGYELARQLSSKNGVGLRLIAITGYGQQADIDRAHDAGFHAHFVKPVALSTLLAAILEPTES